MTPRLLARVALIVVSVGVACTGPSDPAPTPRETTADAASGPSRTYALGEFPPFPDEPLPGSTVEALQAALDAGVEDGTFTGVTNAHDAETAKSLLAPDGAKAMLMHDNVLDRNMFAERLDRDELALALEAERLYGVRYRSVECQPDPGVLRWSDAQIYCSFLMDDRLRQIEGLPPRETYLGIGIQDGRVTVLSFPWTNISWDHGGYYPAEFEAFVPGLDRGHPGGLSRRIRAHSQGIAAPGRG